MLSRPVLLLAAMICAAGSVAAGGAEDRGVGPVTELKLGPVDAALARQGQGMYESKCASCHKFDERYVGPALRGVTERRHPAWIVNWLVNTQEMAMQDATIQEMVGEFMLVMPYQDVSIDDGRAILEYLRQVDAAKAKPK